MKEPLSRVLRVVGNDFKAWGLLQIQVHKVPEFGGSSSTLTVTV